MKKILIYDLPTRIFHALFALSFIGAFSIAKFIDDESALYGVHMLLGLFMSYLVLTRLLWSFFGNEHSALKSLVLSPKELISYVKNLINKESKIYNGHNPASSYLLIIMIIFTLGLAFSGYQMVNRNNKEFFEEIHEIFAHLFLVSAIFHILGIAIHQLKHKDFIGLSMFSGKKTLPNNTNIDNSKSFQVAGTIYLTISLIIFLGLFKAFNQSTGELTIGSNKYQLVEIENENDSENRGAELGNKEHDDQDEDEDDND